jgi:hypothetical protein
MEILITDTILTRLVNFNNVIQQEYQAAEKLQWRAMTLDNMQAYEQAKEKASAHSAIAGYGLYLYMVQKGLRKPGSIYGEPLLQNALLKFLRQLNIPVHHAEPQAALG